MAEAKKQTTGRHRTACKIIEDKAAREVTFSKRHQGMFWKASELAILCGAQVAIIAYLPRGNPFVFSHPSADASKAATAAAICTFDEHKKQYQDAVSKLKETKRDAIEAGERRAAGNCYGPYGQMRWDRHVDDGVGVEELEHYVASLENLMKKVADKLDIRVRV